MSDAPSISVIIPARDARATLGDTLRGLAEQACAERFEVIVVDDGSRDGTAELARSCTRVDHVVRLAGEGPARARNAGAARAASPELAFLDADCLPAPGWLAAGHAALRSAELVLGETRPRIDQPPGPFDRTLTVVGCSPLFESANLFVRRELFERLGGFERWLGPRDGKELGEDVWFGWRAQRSGALISACAPALGYHAVHARGAAGFVAERSRLRFFPALVRRVPELREAFLHRRRFLNPRTASFDAAAAGLALAGLLRRREPALATLAALATVPYLRLLAADAREAEGARKLAVRSAADVVGFAALVAGSARHRTLVL